MNSMQALIDFLKEHPVMSLATSSSNTPHSTPLFYAFDEKHKKLIFISDPLTRHMKEIDQNAQVSVGIYKETKSIGKIQGAQIWGSAAFVSKNEVLDIYLERFPLSRIFIDANPSHLFCEIQIQKARLIDNTREFGEKMEWSFNV